MIEELTKFWGAEFEDFVPEAYNLKHKFRNRWVRFHSLPESKRYPENEYEYLEVLRRHNVLLQKLCGNESRLFVVVPEYSEESAPAQPETKLQELFSTGKHWWTLHQHEADANYESYWHLHASEVKFTGDELDSLFRMVANDEVGNVLIVCPGTRIVYHPYDGGADVVLASTQERDRLKEQLREWLSSHPDGL